MGAHSYEYRVCFDDTDAGRVVYYANYLKFMERARADFFLTNGVSQLKLNDDTNIGFIVSSCEIKYSRPAKLEDLIIVKTRTVMLKKIRFALSQDIYLGNNDLPIVTSIINMSCVDTSQEVMKPTKIPMNIYELLESIE